MPTESGFYQCVRFVSTCPICGRKQCAYLVKMSAKNVDAVVKCKACGHVGTGHDFGLLTDRERKERKAAARKKYDAEHADRKRERNKEYRERNRERINDMRRIMYRRDRSRYEYNLKWRHEHPERCREHNRKYYASNRQTIKLRAVAKQLGGLL